MLAFRYLFYSFPFSALALLVADRKGNGIWLVKTCSHYQQRFFFMGPTWIQDKMAAKTNAKSSNDNVRISAYSAYRPKDTYKCSRVAVLNGTYTVR